jgi:hypothetical protein
MSGMSFGNDVEVNLGIDGFDETGEIVSQDSTVHDGGTCIVPLLSQNFFRQGLVEHSAWMEASIKESVDIDDFMEFEDATITDGSYNLLTK